MFAGIILIWSWEEESQRERESWKGKTL